MTPTSRTKLAAVIGSPVRHSLSPAIHNAAFEAHGDDWVYAAFEVDPANATTAIDAMRVLGIAGLSVTMPHKEMVVTALDRVDDEARLVRAANTVVRAADGLLVGYNTDGDGCVDALRLAGADLASVAVIGAGATARAVVAALARAGASVWVANRSPQRRDEAVSIGNTVRSGSTRSIEIGEVGECATIINTTPQGMAGVSPEAVPFDPRVLSSHHCVLDAVYNPLETPLLRAARERGAKVVDGLDMLCAQAARQQELWLARRPDIALMRRAALAELAKSQR
ncbi:MAG: shikimate dehydrogenase [Ilumatobacteraceae bacterium]